VAKADSAFLPLAELAEDVFGDEDDLGRPADELVLRGVGPGRDEGENGGAVGRGDRDPALARLDAGVEGQLEPELVEVEAQAAILVADEDPDGVDPEVRLGGRGPGLRRRRGAIAQDPVM
jgi:hypothetical protein